MTLKKRILSNGIASIFQKGVRVLEELILVPFFISAWGAAYYGEWLTLTIIPSVMAFSNLGFGTAAANSLVLSYAAGEKQKAADINKTGLYIITIMIFAGIIISLASILLLDYFHVFDKSLINRSEAIQAISFLIVARLLDFYYNLFEAYFRAAERAALSINLRSIRSALNIASGWLILFLGYGIVEFAFTQLLVLITFNCFYWLKGKYILGLYKNYKGRLDKSIIKEITNKGLSYLMLPIWQIIYFQGTTFVVRIVLGPEAVAIFNTVRTLSRSLNQILYMIEPTVFPELQIQIGKNNWKTAQQIFRMSLIGVFLLSTLGFMFLAFFGLWFYNIWTNNELEVTKLMWYIFISGMLFNSMWYTTEMVFRAVNEPKKMGVFGIFAALISVGITYLLAKQIGLIGAAIGAISIDFILVFLIVPYGCKLMKMTFKELLIYGWSDFKSLNLILRNKLLNLKR